MLSAPLYKIAFYCFLPVNWRPPASRKRKTMKNDHKHPASRNRNTMTNDHKGHSCYDQGTLIMRTEAFINGTMFVLMILVLSNSTVF